MYTLIFPFAKPLVKSLMYSADGVVLFVVPLNVIFRFLFVASNVALSFTHSVLYFALIVPLV